jgi:hypothetical protein
MLTRGYATFHLSRNARVNRLRMIEMAFVSDPEKNTRLMNNNTSSQHTIWNPLRVKDFPHDLTNTNINRKACPRLSRSRSCDANVSQWFSWVWKELLTRWTQTARSWPGSPQFPQPHL